MEPNTFYDKLLEKRLEYKAKEVNLPGGMLEKIHEEVNSNGGNTMKLNSFLLNLNMKRALAGTLCALIITAGGVFTFSKEARVLAIEGIDKVTTIFGIKKTGNEYKVVEEKNPTINFGRNLSENISDSEIKEKIGYSANLPESLENAYQLEGKMIIGVSSGPYDETINKWTKASNEELLKDESVEKSISASYKSDTGSAITISVKKGTSVNKKGYKENDMDITETQIGDTILYWADGMIPTYPTKATEDGSMSYTDLTQKPTDLKPIKFMDFEYNGMIYRVQDNGSPLDMEMAKNIAKKIIEMN
ncbi:MAG: hypothetical protein N2645_07610 [Clostridia bacterium]|nr:hypothetical protein [Clostridia bacterium]